ncbi:MAG: sulfurtransferase [Spirochaetota bacterium]
MSRKTLTRGAALVLVLFVVAGAVSAAGTVEPGAPGILVESEWTSANLYHENLVVLETGRSRADYEEGHLPGARYFGREFYYQEVDGVPGMFPGVDVVSAALREAGVDNDSVIVIYDTGSGLWATRLFWTLELLGHDNATVLNGGLEKWTADGFALSDAMPTVARGSFEPDYQAHLVSTGEEVQANLEDLVVVDARSTGEYEGSDVRAERGGHIPGAINVDWVLNNTNEDVNTFLPLDELAEFYEAELDGRKGRIVTHCQTGVRGAHTYFVLRLLGYDDVALYDASWIEWGNDEAFPVTTAAD